MRLILRLSGLEANAIVTFNAGSPEYVYAQAPHQQLPEGIFGKDSTEVDCLGLAIEIERSVVQVIVLKGICCCEEETLHCDGLQPGLYTLKDRVIRRLDVLNCMSNINTILEFARCGLQPPLSTTTKG